MSSLTFGQQMAAAPVTPREGSTTASSEIENPSAYRNTRAWGSGGARSVGAVGVCWTLALRKCVESARCRCAGITLDQDEGYLSAPRQLDVGDLLDVDSEAVRRSRVAPDVPRERELREVESRVVDVLPHHVLKRGTSVTSMAALDGGPC